jgi:hypothetical protein
MIYEPSRENIGGFNGIFLRFNKGSAGFISLNELLLFSNVIAFI